MNREFEKAFFTITSDNIQSITTSRIYGFCLCRETGYKNSEISQEIVKTLLNEGIGNFILVNRTNNRVEIMCDKSYSIIMYLYRKDDYWAISNSFWKLCDEVAKKHQISVDKRYAVSMINASMSSISVLNTYVNEIKMIPYNTDIYISELGKLTLVKKDMDLCTVPINSLDALNIIDNWIGRWGSIFNSIVKQGFPLTIDLTGGFDSRVTFALLNASTELNTENILIKTGLPNNEGDKEHDNGDYDIAKEITEAFKYPHNRNIEDVLEPKVKISSKDSFELYWNTVLPQHSESGHVKQFFYEIPSFRVGGLFGEPIRGAFQGMDVWLSQIDRKGIREFDMLAYGEVLDSFEYVKESSKNSEQLNEYITWVKFFCATWNRNHFGSISFQASCLNNYYLSPLSDYSLLRIRPLHGERDNDLLYALIIMRTCHKLLDFRFAGGKGFRDSTIRMAKMINGIRPRNANINKVCFELKALGGKYFNEEKNDLENPMDALEQIFENTINKHHFISLFGEPGKKVLEKAAREYKNNSLRFQHSAITAIASVMQVLSYTKETDVYQKQGIYWEDYHKLYKMYQKYPAIGRINIRYHFYQLYEYLNTISAKRIIIYGAGRMGNLLYEFLNGTSIKIVSVIDKDPKKKIGEINAMSILEQFPENIDAIIITPMQYDEEIKDFLNSRDIKTELISLKSFFD